MKINGIKISIEDILIDGKIPFSYLSHPWDVSSAVYSQFFSVSAQGETSPRGVCFKVDGSKMYVVGEISDKVHEYNLSTPWNVSTAVWLQSFSVSAQGPTPQGVRFKSDGSKMYVIEELNEDICEYNLSTPWDISTAVWLQSFSVSAQETNPRGVFFKLDGSKVYITGSQANEVNEYNLSTPWNVSTAVWLQSFDASGPITNADDLYFKSDGSKMYVDTVNEDRVAEYNLSTPWDISTAVYLQYFCVTAKEVAPFGLCFGLNGSKMYVVGLSGYGVTEYNL